MKRIVMMLVVLVAVGGTTEVSAQAWLKKLGKKVENAAKNAVERNAERKTEDAVDKVFNGEIGKKNKNNNGNNNADEVYDNGNGDATAQGGKQKVKTAEMSWNKFDFVSGDEIMFEDNQANEQLGEFPSQWDALGGSAEIVSINGTNAIEIMNRGTIIPLMKEKHYLPELFTVEFDFFFHNSGRKYEQYSGDWVNAWFHIQFYDANNKKCFEGRIIPQTREWREDFTSYKTGMRYSWNASGENRNGESQEVELTTEDWHRVSISFNKRALKLYLDQTRLFNIPNMTAPASVSISAYTDAEKCYFIKNIRIAKGAVPLYDRMMSDGKFITYGITFDVGKATIKPESMGEINRIVQLMNENPTLKFSVEGHTDATGKPESNQTLSEQRSKAIVDKLVELGITQDRLTAVGKGQNNPIADNTTDEGRAKNRRVEFVKI